MQLKALKRFPDFTLSKIKMSHWRSLNTQYADICSLLPPFPTVFSEVPGCSQSQENWVWVKKKKKKVSRSGHVVVCKEKGVFLPSIHLGLDAQACMGMFCHFGKASGSTGEVDSSCFLASCLHTVMSGRRSSDRDRVSLSQIYTGTRCPGGWWPLLPTFPYSGKGKSANPLQKGGL